MLLFSLNTRYIILFSKIRKIMSYDSEMCVFYSTERWKSLGNVRC